MRALITIGLAILMTMILAGTASAASLQVSTADASAVKGSMINVPVTVAGASNLGSMDILLVYDPAVLSATAVDKGALNKGIVTANTSSPGVVAISLADSAGMNGDGIVAVITFNVIGNASQTSALTLQSVNAYDATTFLDIPASTASGTFTVKEGAAATAAPTPGKSGSGSLFLISVIGLAAAVALAGKRK